MQVNEYSITLSAYAFAYFLSTILIKYVLYDNGFSFTNILLIIGLVYIRLYLFHKESHRLQEGASLVLFLLFDKNLLDIGNVLLLLGVACIREQFHKDFMYKETISLACGLIFLLMGWFSAGKILIIYALMLFFFYSIMLISSLVFVIAFFSDLLDSLGKRVKEKVNVAENTKL